MPDMAEKYGVDTSNTFAALEDDVEKEKDGKTDEKKKDAPARKKVEKKDKEKHGKSAAKSPPAPETTRAKKHEFDRRPGPGPQRKVDKRSGGGKWDNDSSAQHQLMEDAQITQDQDDTPQGQGEALPNQQQAPASDAKDAKDKKEEKAFLDLDEYRAAQEKKRPKDDALKPRAPRTDGGFREAKEFVKEKEETLKFDLPKPEAKEKKSSSATTTTE